MMSEYAQKLRDPRWQKKRLEILKRDEWTCQKCFDSGSTLAVHHRDYLLNTDPWDYPNDLLITLCEECHDNERTERSGNEDDLLKMLRRLFLAEDIHTFASGFLAMKLQHSHEVVASVYEWALASQEIQRELIDRYLLQLKDSIRAKR